MRPNDVLPYPPKNRRRAIRRLHVLLNRIDYAEAREQVADPHDVALADAYHRFAFPEFYDADGVQL